MKQRNVTGYCMMQKNAVNSNKWAIVRLYDGATKSPAGYIVGDYGIIRDDLDEADAAHLYEFLQDVTAFVY